MYIYIHISLHYISSDIITYHHIICIYIHTVYMFVLVCYRTLCGSSWKSWRARRTLRQSLWDFNFNVGSSDNTVHKVPISIHWLFIIFPNKQMQKKTWAKSSNVRQTHVYHRSHVPFPPGRPSTSSVTGWEFFASCPLVRASGIDHHCPLTLGSGWSGHDFWITGAQGYKQMNVIKKHSRRGLQQKTMVTGTVSGVQGMGVAATGSGDCGKHVQEELQCST